MPKLTEKAKNFLRNKLLIDSTNTSALEKHSQNSHFSQFGSHRILKASIDGKEKYFFILSSLGSGWVSSAQRAILLNGEEKEDIEYLVKHTEKGLFTLLQEFRAASYQREKIAIETLFPGKATSYETDDAYFAIRPLTKGTTLKEIEEDDPYTFIRIVQKILNGLNVLHNEKKLAHGDIKDEHIYINENEQAQFIDFGNTIQNGGSRGLGNTAANILTPFTYLVPERTKEWLGKSSTYAKDTYKLGQILTKKVQANKHLKKNRLLMDLCTKMTHKDAAQRLDTRGAKEAVDRQIQQIRDNIQITLNTFLTERNSDTNYQSLYLTLSSLSAEQLTHIVEEMLKWINNKTTDSTFNTNIAFDSTLAASEPDASLYTSEQREKIRLLKTAYLSLIERNLYKLGKQKPPAATASASAKTFTTDDLINRAKKSVLLNTQLAYFSAFRTTETTSARKLNSIVRHWAPHSAVPEKFVDIKKHHEIFKSLSTIVNTTKDDNKVNYVIDYKKAITHYLTIVPQNTLSFSTSYLYNRSLINLNRQKPYSKIENFAYIGIMPSTHEEKLRDTIHSVVSLADWHEYTQPFNIQTTAPSVWNKHHQISMHEMYDVNIAVDALFKIAQQCQEAKLEEKRVYFNCKTGRSRSAMMLALVLYHEHKYLGVPPNHFFSLEDAYKIIRASGHDIDMDLNERKLAHRIAGHLDAFYTDHKNALETGVVPSATTTTTSASASASASAESEIATSVSSTAAKLNDPQFLWDHVMQLPAMKALLIEAQNKTNEYDNTLMPVTAAQKEMERKQHALKAFLEQITKNNGDVTQEPLWYKQIHLAVFNGPAKGEKETGELIFPFTCMKNFYKTSIDALKKDLQKVLAATATTFVPALK